MGRGITVGVNTHGHCFDGAASAALFLTLLEAIRPGETRRVQIRSCGYGPKMRQVPPGWLTADVNAILDFRYTESDKLTFYFDHHRTGFGSAEEHEEAVRRVSASPDRKLFFDPLLGSCTKLIRDVAERDYGLTFPALDELVAWADTIDSASFASAAAALDRSPAQRIAMVIEQHGDTAFLDLLVPMLRTRSLEEVANASIIADREPPITEAKERFTRLVKQKAIVRGATVFVDLTDGVTSAAGKFVTYALYPEATYSVLLLRTPQLLKLSVGYNPWAPRPRRHDISEIMKREGGGGHLVVGAAAFPPGDLDAARAAADRVLTALETD